MARTWVLTALGKNRDTANAVVQLLCFWEVLAVEAVYDLLWGWLGQYW
jgi:hypothetical protein